MAAAIIDVYRALDQWAPFDTQMDFDNAGFLVGRGEREVRRVLVSLDITEAVAAEAGRWGAELIVSHHPVIFHPVKALTDQTSTGRTLLLLAEQGIGVGRMQVKRQRAAVELMAVLQVAAHLAAVAAGVFRIDVVANRPFGKVADVLFQFVLRIHHHRQVHDGIRWQQIKQGVDTVATRVFSGQQAGGRRFAQAVDDHHFMRAVIQPPDAVLRI